MSDNKSTDYIELVRDKFNLFTSHHLNRSFLYGVLTAATIAFLFKGEIALGAIAAAVGFWFAANDKNRHEIFKKKLEGYEVLQNISAQLYLIMNELSTTSDANEKEKLFFSKYFETFFELSKAQHNCDLFITEEISALIGELYSWTTIESLEEGYLEFDIKRAAMINAMRKDLNIDELHGMSRLLSSLPFSTMKSNN